MPSHPDVVSDAADGDGCVSGQKKVFRHFFSQCHRTKRVQITENNLPLCPVSQTFLEISIKKKTPISSVPILSGDYAK